MTVDNFIETIANFALKNVFNPYKDCCQIFDKNNASDIRKQNLENYLNSLLSIGTDTVWMGRDLGYRGGRRTGIALTDEYHLISLQKIFPTAHFAKATHGKAVAERTAAEIWSALRDVPALPLFWNVFPFHPYREDEPLSNRRFTSQELALADDLNANLFLLFNIKKIIAIGLDASNYAKRYGSIVCTVRHPSYGGVNDFRRGIYEAYAINRSSSPLSDSLF